jgi:hypothetical protein
MPPEISRQSFKLQTGKGTDGLRTGRDDKTQTGKKRPATRKGKRVYTDEVIASLRLVWTFFWYKCGKIPAPLMRRQTGYIARQPAFNITGDIAEKLKTISPAAIDRYLKKDREALRLKGKSLTKPLLPLKSCIPIHAFYSSEERKTPGLRQIDAVHHCGQAASGQYILTLTAADAASDWMRTLVRELRSLLNTAHTWTFKALSDIKTSVPFPVLELHRCNAAPKIRKLLTENWNLYLPIFSRKIRIYTRLKPAFKRR